MKERRSIRKFKPELPSKADFEQIVEAGLYAASGMGKQGTKVIVVTDKKLRDKIMEINRKIGGWDQGFDPFYACRRDTASSDRRTAPRRSQSRPRPAARGAGSRRASRSGTR